MHETLSNVVAKLRATAPTSPINTPREPRTPSGQRGVAATKESKNRSELHEALANVLAKRRATAPTSLINTPLQRGEATTEESKKRFNGFPRSDETVNTASSPFASEGMSLKRSVNEPASYPVLFEAAFGTPDITPDRIARALEQFLLAQTSHDSKFDRVLKGKAQFTAEEQRGFELFHTEYDPRHEQFGADCFHCHGGPL
ncbi:MAG: hypothetical protein DME25_14120, partial [Verrucomicrobia bacterium]